MFRYSIVGILLSIQLLAEYPPIDLDILKQANQHASLNAKSIIKLSDPFMPYIGTHKRATKTKLKKHRSLKLITIINSKAKINNKWYKVGDNIKGYRVDTIKKNSVILLRNKKQKILKIKGSTPSQP